MSLRLEALRRQWNEARDAIAAIEQRAVAESRDLTDTEIADTETLFARCTALDTEIAPLAARATSLAATADVLSRVAGVTPAPAMSTRTRRRPNSEDREATATAGEFLSLFYRSQMGDTEAAELFTRVLAEQTTADNPGVIPVPIVGDLITLADDTRPVFDSFRSIPMPLAGKSFTRPRVTQRVLVAEQAAELDEIASRKMTITGDSVDKRTFAGVLELSEQDIDWTDPAILDIVMADFIGYYGQVTEDAACTYLEALAVNAAAGTWVPTDIGTVVASITAGITTVYNAAKRMPDTMWLSLDETMALAGLTNSDDSVTAFSVLKQALSDAGLGSFKFVTGPQLSADTRIIGSSRLVESFEQRKGFLSAANVSHLGADIAYRGYVAFNGVAAGFTQLMA